MLFPQHACHYAHYDLYDCIVAVPTAACACQYDVAILESATMFEKLFVPFEVVARISRNGLKAVLWDAFLRNTVRTTGSRKKPYREHTVTTEFEGMHTRG